MGNRTLFLKTNGRGDLNQIYFAHGAHAGAWKLELHANGIPVNFDTALAIGRLWKLDCQNGSGQIKASVFLDETMPAAFESIVASAPETSDLKLEITVKVDITAPPSPKGWFNHLKAVFLPRLPRFSRLWGMGYGRYLQTPAPHSLRQSAPDTLSANGRTSWRLSANLPFSSCKIKGKLAEIHFILTIPAGTQSHLNLALAESSPNAHPDALSHIDDAWKSAHEYADWLRSHLQTRDPVLNSLYVSGLNAARSMFKEFPDGFKGLVAGPDYAYPPRIYFRDGYWTAQALIDTAPELVREHLVSLSAGVHPDGKCPSGIFASHLLKEWHAPANCDSDWLADHFDSPAYFILLLNDFLNATGDWELLEQVSKPTNPRLGWPQQTIGEKARAAIDYLISRDSDGDGLIEKPYAANDWADNIRRSTWVSYDQALFTAALKAYAGMCEHFGKTEDAKRYTRKADQALQGMLQELWDDDLGYLVNYRRPGFTEKNLSADTLVSLYFQLLGEDKARRILEAADFNLRAKNNHQQPYGDYGILCAYPPYSKQEDLFDKSAQPFCYHNGADWPYWDGVYASILLERHDPSGLEVLTRWWEYGLEQGWLTPVEYYSPPFPVGGMLQGWSSMPAAILLRQISVIKELMNERSS